MAKVFIVMEEYRKRHNEEYVAPCAVCDTEELAKSIISDRKAYIKEKWADNIDFEDGWEEEIDKPDHYVLSDTCDYEDYFEVYITEMELKTAK